MKKAVFSEADARVSYLTWIGILFFLLYAVCMFFYPAFSNGLDGWNWDYLQRVWDRWQTLNAGVLAFLASVIALNISKYHESKQREWRFTAAKAFLPSALSELIEYFKLSAALLVEAYGALGKNQSRDEISLEAMLPTLPESYVETFRSCIDHAQPEVGAYLANILVELQVHHSRMTELHATLTKPSEMLWLQDNIKSYIFSLGRLYARVGKLFPFARGGGEFDSSDPVWEDYRNAYSLLGVMLEHIDDLDGFTKRAISNAEKETST